MEDLLTGSNENDTLDLGISLMEDNEMTAKFFNFQCISLYGYMNKSLAWEVGNRKKSIWDIVNTPMELYESPYMAKLMISDISDKQLLVFAVNVVNGLYDELDIGQEGMKQSARVVRHMGKYEVKGKKAKAYISYTLQNKKAIEGAYPI